jgi:hypothetical protein
MNTLERMADCCKIWAMSEAVLLDKEMVMTAKRSLGDA